MNGEVPDRFRTIVYGIAATASLGFAAWLGTSVSQMTERLTEIEVTVRESREERLQQIQDLRDRVNRLENRLEARGYYERDAE